MSDTSKIENEDDDVDRAIAQIPESWSFQAFGDEYHVRCVIRPGRCGSPVGHGARCGTITVEGRYRIWSKDVPGGIFHPLVFTSDGTSVAEITEQIIDTMRLYAKRWREHS